MLRFLLFRMWPALIPLGLYLLRLFHKKRKGETLEKHILRGRLFWAIVASILLMLASFLWYGASQPATYGQYVPPHYDGHSLSPAHLSPEAK